MPSSENEIIDTSLRVWERMSERRTDRLADLIHPDGVFGHMGA